MVGVGRIAVHGSRYTYIYPFPKLKKIFFVKIAVTGVTA